ncbi:uncharacterized protein LOC127751428 [Frankliniella occidentalis]|uniref:Uncharacterized protein LOC127751428 n=1 Tax=Frankliniella occidentalis TaxID=133901 RepID=A0A9C6X848_FRAOC|nr:uncharacterized protein LOC127751428 [Frankliniella occidentalis]
MSFAYVYVRKERKFAMVESSAVCVLDQNSTSFKPVDSREIINNTEFKYAVIEKDTVKQAHLCFFGDSEEQKKGAPRIKINNPKGLGDLVIPLAALQKNQEADVAKSTKEKMQTAKNTVTKNRQESILKRSKESKQSGRITADNVKKTPKETKKKKTVKSELKTKNETDAKTDWKARPSKIIRGDKTLKPSSSSEQLTQKNDCLSENEPNMFITENGPFGEDETMPSKTVVDSSAVQGTLVQGQEGDLMSGDQIVGTSELPIQNVNANNDALVGKRESINNKSDVAPKETFNESLNNKSFAISPNNVPKVTHLESDTVSLTQVVESPKDNSSTSSSHIPKKVAEKKLGNDESSDLCGCKCADTFKIAQENQIILKALQFKIDAMCNVLQNDEPSTSKSKLCSIAVTNSIAESDDGAGEGTQTNANVEIPEGSIYIGVINGENRFVLKKELAKADKLPNYRKRLLKVVELVWPNNDFYQYRLTAEEEGTKKASQSQINAVDKLLNLLNWKKIKLSPLKYNKNFLQPLSEAYNRRQLGKFLSGVSQDVEKESKRQLEDNSGTDDESPLKKKRSPIDSDTDDDDEYVDMV